MEGWERSRACERGSVDARKSRANGTYVMSQARGSQAAGGHTSASARMKADIGWRQAPGGMQGSVYAKMWPLVLSNLWLWIPI